jgi:hypothetical protein
LVQHKCGYEKEDRQPSQQDSEPRGRLLCDPEGSSADLHRDSGGERREESGG